MIRTTRTSEKDKTTITYNKQVIVNIEEDTSGVMQDIVFTKNDDNTITISIEHDLYGSRDFTRQELIKLLYAPQD